MVEIENILLSDIFLATLVIHEDSAPQSWYERNGSSFTRSRRILLIFWITAGTVLLQSYKAMLRASLINIPYQKPIDTWDDFYNSDLSLLLTIGSGYEQYCETEPLPLVRKICTERGVWYPFNGTAPKWMYDM